ncbi:MAG: AEC family transporter [Synergistaceae bacterium]|nr:AEC family transporter [Synergistaceae bacterium]
MKGFYIVLPLALVILLGMALRTKGFFSLDDKDRLARLLYWVVLPVMFFRTTYLAGDSMISHFNLALAAYAAIVFTPASAFVIAAAITHKGDRMRQAISTMAAGRSNTVYLGIPACMLALGPEGAEAASLYVAFTVPGYQIVSILCGEAVMSGRITRESLARCGARVIKNPLVISCVLGFCAALSGIPVPEPILTAMKLIADMATGLALIALGLSLEVSGLLTALRRTWHDALIKLFLHPALTWAFLLIWPAPDIFFKSAVILAAMPTAINTFIIAGGMGLDEKYTCELVALSTVLSAFSIPAWIAVLGIS